MKAKDNRPINLNLFTIRFPVTAIASIFHRVTGVILFLGLPLMLFAWQNSLQSAESFESLNATLHEPLYRFIAWALIVSLGYHFIAGIRHLLMDMHIGESKQGGRLGAWLVLISSGLFALSVGLWLW
jgi:succinate dehydrogenase / fumarate reductase cytochrome b subunit